jgi:hypothetical protein
MNSIRQGGAAVSIRESSNGVVGFPDSLNHRDVNPMDRADLYRVYELGGAIHGLSSVTTETALGEYFRVYIEAEKALDNLLGPNPQLKVELCVGAARELSAVITRLENTYFRDDAKKWLYPKEDTKTLGYQAHRLVSALQNFEAVFRAEMQAASTYWVPKRGTHSTRDLVDAFDRTFLPELHASLGEVALNEYRNAGRCFAFGLWTAAGYHSCRAVEAVLRPYYRKFTGKEDKEGKTWGNLIEELESVAAEPKPNEKTIFYLRQIKDNERNPLMHVRVVLDEQDADLLLSAAKIVMVLMTREMIAIEAEELATPLLLAITGTKAS